MRPSSAFLTEQLRLRLQVWVQEAARLLTRSKYVQAVALVATGNFASQAISFLAIAIVAVFVTPATLGEFGVLVSIAGMIAPLASLGYPVALPVSVSRAAERNLLNLSLLLTLAIPVASGIAALLLLKFWPLPGMDWTLFGLVAAAVAANSLILTGVNLNIRRGNYRIIAKFRVFQYALAAALMIAVAVSTNSGRLLFAAQTAAFLVVAVAMFHSTRAWPSYPISPVSMAVTARYYAAFPTKHLPGSVIAQAGWLAIHPLVAFLFGAEAAGSVFLAERLVIAPVVLVGAAVAQVFYGRSAESRRSIPTLVVLSRKTAIVLFGIGIAIAGGVIVFALHISKYLFNPQWHASSTIIIYFALTIPPMLAIYPVAAFQVIGRQDQFLFWGIGRLLLTVLSLAVPAWLGMSAGQSIAICCAGIFLSYIAMGLMWWRALAEASRRQVEIAAPSAFKSNGGMT